ncbi:MAG: DUF1015 domain-containing protein [Phycisphaerales bacterium]|nr:DUF1015 domain-containing protein [Phycisphaerales bacterium]
MQIHPFAAIRSPAHRVSEVSCPPYDVVSLAEATAIASARPNSFMRVIRPEVDFAADQDPHAAEVYERGLDNLHALIGRGFLVREPSPVMYVYRQARGGRKQAGLACCVGVDAYLRGEIRKHELTRPDKELDRTQHMLTVGAHCEPVLLTVTGELDFVRQLGRDMNHRPLFHFLARDGVTHTLWAVQDAEAYHGIFKGIERAYIADGHHRCAAAARVAEQLGASESSGDDAESGRFPAVIFPAEELVILAYHRLARFASGQSSESVHHALAKAGSLEPILDGADPAPAKRGEIGVFLGGKWLRFRLPAVTSESPLDQLDVVRLTHTVLAPILGINEERTNPRISFLGGCSTDRLAQTVLDGSSDIAFAMHPTSISELLLVASANLIMPPKSTWFDPKICSGLFLHPFASSSAGGLLSQR